MNQNIVCFEIFYKLGKILKQDKFKKLKKINFLLSKTSEKMGTQMSIFPIFLLR